MSTFAAYAWGNLMVSLPMPPFDLAAFRRSVERKVELLNPSDPSWVNDCREDVGRLVNGGAIQQTVNGALKHLLSSPKADASAWLDTGVTMAFGKAWTLRLTIYEREASGIYSLPHVGLIQNVGRTSYAYRLYELPNGYINEQFKKGAPLGPSFIVEMPPGGVAYIDGRTHALDVIIDQPATTLRLYAHLPSVLQWKFDRESLSASEAFAGQVDGSELVSMAIAIGALGDSRGIPTLETLASHPAHFVRWTAIKQLGRLSPAKAIEFLKKSINDPHPEVRSAAKMSLANIQGLKT